MGSKTQDERHAKGWGLRLRLMRRFMLGSFCCVMLAACSVSVPSDPEGTLEQVSGRTIRVGVTNDDPWVRLKQDQDPAGTEPDLLRSFAASLDAEPRWIPGSEQELVQSLKDGDVDVVIGGFTDDTPWSTDAGTTRPYTESTDDQGRTEKHVMLVPLGENAFLLELDRFLLKQNITS